MPLVDNEEVVYENVSRTPVESQYEKVYYVDENCLCTDVDTHTDAHTHAHTHVYVNTQTHMYAQRHMCTHTDMDVHTPKNLHLIISKLYLFQGNGPLLPSSKTEPVMYSQMSASRHQEIQRSALYMGRVLGEGEFGTVHYATWHRMGKPLVVAVKVCNEHCSTSEKLQLMREAAVIGQFDHPRVVRLYGVVTLSEPVS